MATPKRGRPLGSVRVEEPMTSVSTWLKASEHERLQQLAKKHEQSISKTVRALLVLRLPSH